jgi:DNA polymerase III alpha subunit
MAAAGLDDREPRARHFARLWYQMQDLPRHLGQHSGGLVICQDDLSSVVPLENASMPGRVVVQWDKDDCADMGLIKVDLLGLGMMAVLQDAIALVNGGAGGRVGKARARAKADSISRICRKTRTCIECCRRPTPSACFRSSRARRWRRCRG